MKLILFVCRGNTCRSPMAEVAARRAASMAGIGGRFTFGSAGTAPAKIGVPADPRAIACVAAAGLDLTAHRTRAASADLLQSAHLVLALDSSILEHVRLQVDPVTRSQVGGLMTYAPETGVAEVADPWAGTAADYAQAFALIRSGVDGLVAGLRTG